MIPLNRFQMGMQVCRRYETFEQWMRLVRLAEKFRVELAGNEKRMVFQLDHLHQFAVRRETTEYKTGIFKFFTVGVVEFITVAVALMDHE